MTRHDETVRLRHMLDFARQAKRICEARSREELDEDEFFPLALARIIELIGEAARFVSPERRSKLHGVPWGDIVGTRDRLAHGYPDVNFNILWDIVENGLPTLILELERELDAK